MSFIRLQENVPEVYINASRDFQLLCRLYDCMINSVKFSIDGVLRVIDTRLCSNALLSLLQTKLGFFTEKDFSYDEIRYVLRAFPDIIKYKGSKRGILQAVYVFCKLKHIQTIPNIEIINKQNDKPIYQINIILYATPQDTTLLSEIFRYILPTGYTVRYSWRTKEATRVYETYSFNDEEKKAFPILLRYINTFWWYSLSTQYWELWIPLSGSKFFPVCFLLQFLLQCLVAERAVCMTSINPGGFNC